MLKKNTIIGGGMIAVGILLIIENTVGISIDIWNIIWPLFLLIPGIITHINYFSGKGDSGSIVLGGILIIYGAFFLLKSITNLPCLDNMDYIYTLGIGIGFLESYLFGKKNNTSLLFTVLFFAVSIYIFIKTVFPEIRNINDYIFPTILIILGFYMLLFNIRNKK